MPRVPTARVTSGQISYTPTGSVAASAFGALAELTGKAADIAMDARNKLIEAEVDGELTNQVHEMNMGLTRLRESGMSSEEFGTAGPALVEKQVAAVIAAGGHGSVEIAADLRTRGLFAVDTGFATLAHADRQKMVSDGRAKTKEAVIDYKQQIADARNRGVSGKADADRLMGDLAEAIARGGFYSDVEMETMLSDAPGDITEIMFTEFLTEARENPLQSESILIAAEVLLGSDETLDEKEMLGLQKELASTRTAVRTAGERLKKERREEVFGSLYERMEDDTPDNLREEGKKFPTRTEILDADLGVDETAGLLAVFKKKINGLDATTGHPLIEDAIFGQITSGKITTVAELSVWLGKGLGTTRYQEYSRLLATRKDKAFTQALNVYLTSRRPQMVATTAVQGQDVAGVAKFGDFTAEALKRATELLKQGKSIEDIFAPDGPIDLMVPAYKTSYWEKLAISMSAAGQGEAIRGLIPKSEMGNIDTKLLQPLDPNEPIDEERVREAREILLRALEGT